MGDAVGECVIKTKPLWVDACAWYRYSEALHQRLIIPSRFKRKLLDADGKPVYDENDEPVMVPVTVDTATIMVKGFDKLIGVPREWCDFPYRKTTLDQRVAGKVMELGDKCLFPPKNDEQFRVIKESTALLTVGSNHIVEASTGFGKTYCGLNIINNLGRKTLIVVTKEDLMVSWPKEITKFFGVPADEIGIIQQKKCQVEGKRIVVAMIHSLAQREYPDWVKDEFGLVIFDEVHHVGAETFSKVAAMFPAKLRLGFSATPHRIDGKDFVFHGHIGKPKVQAKLLPMPPKILVKYSGWKVPTVPRRVNGEFRRVQLPHEAGRITNVVSAMAQSSLRNSIIVRLALQAYNKGRWTVVLSELAEDKHLGMLREMCKRAGVPDSDMAYYKGGMSESAREEAKGKRLVFATYGMTGEATDVPWWDCGILATPRANVTQALGRFCREYPGKPKPVIIDIVDTDSDVLHGYFKSRLKQYTSAETKGEVVYL